MELIRAISKSHTFNESLRKTRSIFLDPFQCRFLTGQNTPIRLEDFMPVVFDLTDLLDHPQPIFGIDPLETDADLEIIRAGLAPGDDPIGLEDRLSNRNLNVDTNAWCNGNARCKAQPTLANIAKIMAAVGDYIPELVGDRNVGWMTEILTHGDEFPATLVAPWKE